MDLKKHIEKKFGRIVFEFEVMYTGWEFDQVAFVVEGKNNKHKLIMTSHGIPYVAKTKELDDFIRKYEEAKNNAVRAKTLLEFTNPF